MHVLFHFTTLSPYLYELFQELEYLSSSLSFVWHCCQLHFTKSHINIIFVRSCVQMVQYGCPVSSTGTSQSRVVGQPIQQTASISKEPPIPKPKPSLPIKPSISLSSGVAHESSALTTSPQPNSATDAIVYARPRPSPAGQPMYDVSRTFSSLVPPPPPPQRPTRPLSSILVPNSKSNEDSAHQLAQAINQSLLISRPQSVSQSSLSDR